MFRKSLMVFLTGLTMKEKGFFKSTQINLNGILSEQLASDCSSVTGITNMLEASAALSFESSIVAKLIKDVEFLYEGLSAKLYTPLGIEETRTFNEHIDDQIFKVLNQPWAKRLGLDDTLKVTIITPPHVMYDRTVLETIDKVKAYCSVITTNDKRMQDKFIVLFSCINHDVKLEEVFNINIDLGAVVFENRNPGIVFDLPHTVDISFDHVLAYVLI